MKIHSSKNCKNQIVGSNNQNKEFTGQNKIILISGAYELEECSDILDYLNENSIEYHEITQCINSVISKHLNSVNKMLDDYIQTINNNIDSCVEDLSSLYEEYSSRLNHPHSQS